MNLIGAIFIYFTSQFLITKADLPVEDDYVFVLSSKNFDNFVNNNEFTVVFFYAPWCGHCVSMKPFYHEAAKMLREDESIKTDKPVVFAKVDATVETDLASKFEIQGYPTLKIFRKSVSYDYDGPRQDAKAIVNYLTTESSNNWKPLVSKVDVLSKSNFSEWVEKYDISLVEFYAPWCGHCKRLAPNYEKAARILSEETEPIPLAKVDSTLEQELTAKYDVKGYPTLFVFRKGRHYEYKGGRDTHDIVNTMLKLRSSGSNEVKNFNSFTSYVTKPTEIYVLGLFNSQNDKLFEIYNHFASKYFEDLKIFHSFNTNEFLKHFKSDNIKLPCILVYYHDLVMVKNEPKFRVFDKQELTNVEELEEFVFKKSLPLVGHLSEQNKELVYNQIRPLCYVFYDVDFELRSHVIFIRDKVALVARKFNQIKFVLANQTEHLDLIKKYNLEDSKSETSVVCLNDKSKVFILDEDNDSFDEEEVVEFVKKFLDGKLTPLIKSEVMPKDNEKKNVKKLVGKTIDNVLLNEKRDLVLAFVGHEHSKDLPEFETNLNKLALKYKNVYFGKINMFKNDYPDLFRPNQNKPSFYFVPSYNRLPVLAKSNTFNDLIEFIEENLQISNSKSHKNEL